MINFLQNLKLSLTQWLLLTAATIIGGLCVALRLQGTRLHYYKIKALEEHYDGIDKDDDKAVKAAHDRFQKALDEYNGEQK